MVASSVSANSVLPSARASSALFLTSISARATPRENSVASSSCCGAASSSCGAGSSSCGAGSSPADSLGRASSSGCAAGPAADSLVRARFGGSACASAVCSMSRLPAPTRQRRASSRGRDLPFQAHAANVGFVKPSCCALGLSSAQRWLAVKEAPASRRRASGCKTLASSQPDGAKTGAQVVVSPVAPLTNTSVLRRSTLVRLQPVPRLT